MTALEHRWGPRFNAFRYRHPPRLRPCWMSRPFRYNPALSRSRIMRKLEEASR